MAWLTTSGCDTVHSILTKKVEFQFYTTQIKSMYVIKLYIYTI